MTKRLKILAPAYFSFSLRTPDTIPVESAYHEVPAKTHGRQEELRS
jgi:hypothetical protein